MVPLLVGIITGIIGTSLGIINFIWLASDRLIKLKITFKLSSITPAGMLSIAYPFTNSIERIKSNKSNGINTFPCIEVVNRSKFTIYIDEVGLKSDKKEGENRAVVMPNVSIPNAKFPYKIEPFASISLFASLTDINELPDDKKFVYATASHGKTFYSKLRNYRKVIADVKDAWGKI